MNIDFEKNADGLVPAIVQDARTQKVLMLGYMNDESLALTRSTGRVTFFSRSRDRLWTKGETSGNFLLVEQVLTDCDSDTVLVKAVPEGPVCHTGADTCFGESNVGVNQLTALEATIRSRKASMPTGSYTSELFGAGIDRIAQKVGEEAVELVIAAKNADPEPLKAEAADLIYHLLVLLTEKGVALDEVLATLRSRSSSSAEG